MRPSQKSSRNRSRGGRKPNGSNINRVYESAGPEGKVRGTPQQIIDKYLTLARDAQTVGDRVIAENFLQHAEHYQRLLIEAMGARQERREGFQSDQDQPDVDGQDDGGSDEDADDVIVMHPRGSQRDGQSAGGERRDRRERGDRGDRSDRGGDRGDRGGDRGSRGGDQGGRRSEVSGLTTIDSGQPDGGSLLVDTEDLSASQPPRRRRTPEQSASSEPSDAAEAGSTTPPEQG